MMDMLPSDEGAGAKGASGSDASAGALICGVSGASATESGGVSALRLNNDATAAMDIISTAAAHEIKIIFLFIGTY